MLLECVTIFRLPNYRKVYKFSLHYENASKEYSGKMIKNLVEELKAGGWVFAYIGANQDVDAVADSMSIQNRMAYVGDIRGTEMAHKKMNKSRLGFFDKISKKMSDAKIDLQNDFFEEY